MVTQQTAYYNPSNFTQFISMKEGIDDRIKRGWLVKFMCQTNEGHIFVVYEKEVVEVKVDDKKEIKIN